MITQRFRACKTHGFGYNARVKEIRARAPTRIDFVGGWTDVQPFCDDEPGIVINAACSVFARVIVRDAQGQVETLDKFIRAACKRFGLENVQVQLSSDAPLGSGLGGSGAAGVALVGALAAYADKKLERREIAELAHQIEVEDLNIIGGKQDQYAAAFGGFLNMTFHGAGVELESLTLSTERIQELQSRSVVVYTGQTRLSGNIHAHVQDAFRARNSETLAALATIRRVASEFRTELQCGTLDALAELLNENWDAQKRLHLSTTNERVDEFFRIAFQAGADGGKALGAGGGGCLYFLAKKGETERLQNALVGAGGVILPGSFDLQGLEIASEGLVWL